MCGRFKAGFEFRDIKIRSQIFNNLDFAPHYNIAPSAAVRVTGGRVTSGKPITALPRPSPLFSSSFPFRLRNIRREKPYGLKRQAEDPYGDAQKFGADILRC